MTMAILMILSPCGVTMAVLSALITRVGKPLGTLLEETVMRKMSILLVCGAAILLAVKTGAETREKAGKPIRPRIHLELKATWTKLQKKIDKRPEEQVEALQLLYKVLIDTRTSNALQSEILEYFVRHEATVVVRECLLLKFPDHVVRASKYLGKKRDRGAVPYLIYVLDKNNYSLREGGEMIGVHKTLKKTLVEAILDITGLKAKAGKVDVDKKEDVDRVLSLARSWAKEKRLTPLETRQSPKETMGPKARGNTETKTDSTDKGASQKEGEKPKQ